MNELFTQFVAPSKMKMKFILVLIVTQKKLCLLLVQIISHLSTVHFYAIKMLCYKHQIRVTLINVSQDHS